MMYSFTIDDPRDLDPALERCSFRFDKDDEQYELVEYACHEGQLRHDEHP